MKRVLKRVVISVKRFFRLHRLAGITLLVLGGLAVGGGAYAALGGAPKQSASGDIELSRGLVGQWKLDGNAKDSTPTRSNGTVSGATLTTDREGKTNSAYSFDGVNDDISLADRNSFSPSVNDMSMSFWARVPTGATSAGDGVCGGTGRYMLAKGIAANWEWGFENDNNARACIMLWTSSGSSYAQLSSVRTMNDNLWHHYAATIDYGTSVTFYIDGVQVGTTSLGSGMTNGTKEVQIGRRGDGNFFSGNVDDVRIYNRLINTAEIGALYSGYNTQLSAASGEKGLLGWWKMDGSAKDASPYRQNGSVTGATLTTDREGKASSAYDFNGTTQYVSANPALPTGDFTYGAWIKLDSNADETIVMASDGAGSNELYLYVATTLRTFTNNVQRAASAATIPTGVWTHIAVTRSGGTITQYINGVVDGTGTDATALTFSSCLLYIGMDTDSVCSGSPGNYLDGSIDDVRVYNRALSANEVLNIWGSYNSQISVSDLQKGMVGYWPLNGNAKDATPYRNNGTLVNSPTLTTDRKGRANSAYTFSAASLKYINPGTSVPSITGGDFTVSAWARATAGANNTTIFSQNIPASWSNNLFILYYGDNGGASGGIRVWWVSSNLIVNTTSVIDSIWHLVTLSKIGNNFFLYKDGVQISTSSSAGTFTATHSYIGAANNNGTMSQFFNGSLSDVRVYKRGLSAAEVKALYELYN